MFPIPKPSDAMATKVVDTTTNTTLVGAGEIGELLVRGPSVFDGYFKHQQNGEVFDEQGYFHTGNLVEICAAGNGYYKIAGRCCRRPSDSSQDPDPSRLLRPFCRALRDLVGMVCLSLAYCLANLNQGTLRNRRIPSQSNRFVL